MPYRRRPLSVAVNEFGSTFYLHLSGDFDRGGVGRVEKALGRLAQTPVPRRVVIDIQRLSFLDSAGLRTILRADERGRAEGFGVDVVRPRGAAARVFTLTRAGQKLSMIDAPGLG